MPLIKDISERRYAFQARRERSEIAPVNVREAGFSINLQGLEGLEDLPKRYVNRGLLLRVNRKLANEFRAGMTSWPEETQFSRQSFRGSDQGLTNVANYATYVEDRKNPKTYPPQPARRYVEGRWVPLAEDDIAGQIRRRS